ncbi:MAG: 50S ribosomal protein L35 [Bacillota bacterium]
MPKTKLKTHRGAAKRFWISGSGKIRKMRAGKTHKAEVKPAKRKRRLRQSTGVNAVDEKRVRLLIPFK